MQDLVEQRDALNEQIAGQKRERAKELMVEVAEMLAKEGFTIKELVSMAGVKYQKGSDTWTGRGRRPDWAKDLEPDELAAYAV